MAIRKNTILNLLEKALLQGGEMDLGLYEHELEEHINEWYKGLKADREDYVFVVTENSGRVAMVMIAKDKTIYVNEEAREKLSQVFLLNYERNIKLLLPMMAEDLDSGMLFVNGVSVVDKPKRRWVKGKGFGG